MRLLVWAMGLWLLVVLGLLVHLTAQAPTVVIPPEHQNDWWVCAVYHGRQAACKPAGAVRAFLDQR